MSQLYSINAGAGDCWGDAHGNFVTNGTFLWVGGTPDIDGDPRTWIPFTVPLPRITIVSATLKWRATQTRSEGVSVSICCEAADNPSTPGSNADIFGRVLTTARLNTSLAAYTTGDEYSYNVAAPVQEVLSRAGWVAGNTLAILVKDNGTSSDNRRQVASVENTSYAQAILEIVIPKFIPRNGGVI